MAGGKGGMSSVRGCAATRCGPPCLLAPDGARGGVLSGAERAGRRLPPAAPLWAPFPFFPPRRPRGGPVATAWPGGGRRPARWRRGASASRADSGPSHGPFRLRGGLSDWWAPMAWDVSGLGGATSAAGAPETRHPAAAPPVARATDAADHVHAAHGSNASWSRGERRAEAWSAPRVCPTGVPVALSLATCGGAAGVGPSSPPRAGADAAAGSGGEDPPSCSSAGGGGGGEAAHGGCDQSWQRGKRPSADPARRKKEEHVWSSHPRRDPQPYQAVTTTGMSGKQEKQIGPTQSSSESTPRHPSGRPDKKDKTQPTTISAPMLTRKQGCPTQPSARPYSDLRAPSLAS